MDLVALSSRLLRRWWVVVGLAALAALGAATAGASKTDEHRTRIQFVLRPDASVTNGDLPGTLDALKSDGTLVQTVIGVLRNRAILRRAAAEVDVSLNPAYSVDSSVQPGSTLIDSTLSGPDRSVLNRLATGYAREASTYVSASYAAYVLEPISTDTAPDGTGPGTAQVVVLAALLGAALGVLLVAAELRLEPRLKRGSARTADSDGDGDADAPAPASEPEPEPKAKSEPEPQAEPLRPPGPIAQRPPARLPENGHREPSWRRDSPRPSPRPPSGPKPAHWRPGPSRGEDED